MTSIKSLQPARNASVNADMTATRAGPRVCPHLHAGVWFCRICIVNFKNQETHQSTSGLSPDGCRRRTLNMKLAIAPAQWTAYPTETSVSFKQRAVGFSCNTTGSSPPTIVTLLRATALFGWKSATRLERSALSRAAATCCMVDTANRPSGASML